MTLQSMTGFSRQDGLWANGVWRWELRSVNGKGLDMRLRLPPGYDALEADLKARIASSVTRGSLSASLTIERSAATAEVKVNEAVLEGLARLANAIARNTGLAAPSMDGLLAVRGVVEVIETSESEDERAEIIRAVTAGFDVALRALVAMRAAEGATLRTLLLARLDEIAALKAEAERNPARQPAAIQARLAESLKALLEQASQLDPARLHQEALLLAAKVDIREELDRLDAHVAAARRLLNEQGAIGRRLDFLAQEFNRESNTLCSKSNNVALTATGLQLKAVVEQFREQVQNLE